MYPAMEMDGGVDYYLKPMNCPFHILIYESHLRSYRELPLRLFEFGTVYRYEMSGVVQGLTRARGFTQDDAHIFCTREQMLDEIVTALNFVLDLLRDYGHGRLLPRTVDQARGEGGRQRCRMGRSDRASCDRLRARSTSRW